MTNANTGQKPSPMLKAAGLWAKSSVKGGQYLTGRLGGVKVLILENRDRQSDDDPSHHLFFVEAPDRRQLERPQSVLEPRGLRTHPGRLRTHQRCSAEASRASQRRPWAPGPGARPQAPLDRDGPQPARDVLDDVPEWAR